MPCLYSAALKIMLDANYHFSKVRVACFVLRVSTTVLLTTYCLLPTPSLSSTLYALRSFSSYYLLLPLCPEPCALCFFTDHRLPITDYLSSLYALRFTLRSLLSKLPVLNPHRTSVCNSFLVALFIICKGTFEPDNL